MNKITEFIKNFLQTRTIAFYVACGIALLSAVVGIVSGATLAFAGNTVLAIVLPLLGLPVFAILSVVGQERMGVAATGLLAFGALIALICGVYGHFFTEIQSQAMTGFNIGAIDGFMTLIVCVILFVVCAIAENVLAWLCLQKKPAPAAEQAE